MEHVELRHFTFSHVNEKGRYRESLARPVAFQWGLDMYRRHRDPSAEIAA